MTRTVGTAVGLQHQGAALVVLAIGRDGRALHAVLPKLWSKRAIGEQAHEGGVAAGAVAAVDPATDQQLAVLLLDQGRGFVPVGAAEGHDALAPGRSEVGQAKARVQRAIGQQAHDAMSWSAWPAMAILFRS